MCGVPQAFNGLKLVFHKAFFRPKCSATQKRLGNTAVEGSLIRTYSRTKENYCAHETRPVIMFEAKKSYF
jgi:hypothetical protein